MINQKLKQLQLAWNVKQNTLLDLAKVGIPPEQDDLFICLPGCNWLLDYSLTCDHGIFKYKSVDTLIKLWNCNFQELIDFITMIIEWQVRVGNDHTVNEAELSYSASLQNIVAWILKNKYKVDPKTRKRIMSGDYKPKTHFTLL